MGLSRMLNSSAENGKRETTKVLSGIRNRMMMGNPTAAGNNHTNNKRDGRVHSARPRSTRGRGRTDRLRDRKGRAKGQELHRNEKKDTRFAHASEWLAVWGHRAVREEVENLLGDSVS